MRDRIRNAAGPNDLIEGWGVKGGNDLAHPLADRLASVLPEVYDLLVKPTTRVLALVRDPMARCISAYHEHLRQFSDLPQACSTLSAYLDQIEAAAYREEQGHLFIHGTPQTEFLMDGDRMLATHVFSLHDPLWFHKAAVTMNLDLGNQPEANVPRRVLPFVARIDVERILGIYQRDYELLDRLHSGCDQPEMHSNKIERQ